MAKRKKRKILTRPRKPSHRSQVLRFMGRLLSWGFLIVFVLTSVVVLVTPSRVREVKEAEKVILKERATPKEIGLFYVREGDYLEAKRYLYQAYQHSPDDPELLRNLIEASKYTGDLQILARVLPRYISMIESRIRDVEQKLKSLKEELYRAQGDERARLEEEVTLTEGQLASYYSSWIEMKVLYAQALTLSGHLQEALQIARELKKRFPKNRKLRNLEETLVFLSGDPKAIVSFLQTKPKEDWKRRHYLMMGTSYLALKEYAKAREVYQEALERYPSDEGFLIGLLQTYRQEGRYDEVLRLLKEKVGYTEDPRLLYYYGEALYKLGKRDEAEKYFQEAIAKAEDDLMKAEIKRLVTELKRGEEDVHRDSAGGNGPRGSEGPAGEGGKAVQGTSDQQGEREAP